VSEVSLACLKSPQNDSDVYIDMTRGIEKRISDINPGLGGQKVKKK